MPPDKNIEPSTNTAESVGGKFHSSVVVTATVVDPPALSASVAEPEPVTRQFTPSAKSFTSVHDDPSHCSVFTPLLGTGCPPPKITAEVLDVPPPPV